MANFQVPQFIETKAKIIGPLTLTQFFYLAGGAAIGFIAFQIFSFFLAFSLTAVFAVVAIALAFFKVNGQEMPKVILAAFAYYLRPRLYTWQRIAAQKELAVPETDILDIRKNMSLQEKLKDLAEKVTTGKLFTLEKIKQGRAKERYQTVRRLTGEQEMAKRVDYA